MQQIERSYGQYHNCNFSLLLNQITLCLFICEFEYYELLYSYHQHNVYAFAKLMWLDLQS